MTSVPLGDDELKAIVQALHAVAVDNATHAERLYARTTSVNQSLLARVAGTSCVEQTPFHDQVRASDTAAVHACTWAHIILELIGVADQRLSGQLIPTAGGSAPFSPELLNPLAGRAHHRATTSLRLPGAASAAMPGAVSTQQPRNAQKHILAPKRPASMIDHSALPNKKPKVNGAATFLAGNLHESVDTARTSSQQAMLEDQRLRALLQKNAAQVAAAKQKLIQAEGAMREYNELQAKTAAVDRSTP